MGWSDGSTARPPGDSVGESTRGLLVLEHSQWPSVHASTARAPSRQSKTLVPDLETGGCRHRRNALGLLLHVICRRDELYDNPEALSTVADPQAL